MFKLLNTYHTLPDSLYTRQNPVGVNNPEVFLLNNSLAREIGIDLSLSQDLKQTLSGNSLLPGSRPLAQAYGGHQFGHFTILGDGRAILLGEHQSDLGLLDIQLKGSGRTPYSRRGDGRASLGPMLREYIISEALFNLGVPTTRSLGVLTTGENILREKAEPGAILTRIASSHIRIGTFQYAAALGERETLTALLDYTLKRHYPHLLDSREKALELWEAVGEKQAFLIAQWMRIGFIHGVMNTDNTTVSGESIDFGPCAFMDEFDPACVFSSIDRHGRYAFQNQPAIIHWNMARFAEALLPLFHRNREKSIEIAQEALNRLAKRIDEEYLKAMASKIGIKDPQEKDWELITELLKWIHTKGLDFTNTFRGLSLENSPQKRLFQEEPFLQWYQQWSRRIQDLPKQEVVTTMNNNNPSVIPRNHIVQKVINRAVEDRDPQPVEDFLKNLENPYREVGIRDEFKQLPTPNERVFQTFCGT